MVTAHLNFCHGRMLKGLSLWTYGLEGPGLDG